MWTATRILREPIGVCGLITPWNWPINQIACKVAPALAAGCTMVLKPSEVAPLSALLFAEVLHEAGVPPGVFNLVNGDGATVGEAIARDPDIDMVSFTGSTRAGIAVAKAAAERITVGDPQADGVNMGPVVSAAQFARMQNLITQAIDDETSLLTGGAGRPAHLATGYYVQPTIFTNVRNSMTIAREEVFGPVLCLMPYDSDDDAINIANDSPYGLSGYVSSGDPERAMRVARAMRSRNVHVNGAPVDHSAPFGGYKQSGNGREWGEFGFKEFLEVKAVMGYAG